MDPRHLTGAPATVPEFTSTVTASRKELIELLNTLSVRADATGGILLSASQMRAIAESVGAFRRPQQ